jgi:hypothetical protein
MSNPASLNPNLLPMTKKLAGMCRQCLIPDDDGFMYCAQNIDALLAHPTSPFVWGDATSFMLEATRVGFEAAIDGREGHFHIAAAVYHIGNGWTVSVASDGGGASAVLRSFNEATKHLHAAELVMDRPDVVPLDADGNVYSAFDNVVPFPHQRQTVPVPKAANVRAELRAVTQQVLEASERCRCKDCDCFRDCARHFRALLANKRSAKAEPAMMDMDVVQVGFFAKLDGLDAHFHLAASARAVGTAWTYIAELGNDDLSMANEEIQSALEHLRLANHGKAMKKECNQF